MPPQVINVGWFGEGGLHPAALFPPSVTHAAVFLLLVVAHAPYSRPPSRERFSSEAPRQNNDPNMFSFFWMTTTCFSFLTPKSQNKPTLEYQSLIYLDT
jgi:hypothetical protein